MIVKPPFLRVGSHPVASGLVFAAAPGPDTPFEALEGGLWVSQASSPQYAATMFGWGGKADSSSSYAMYYPPSRRIRSIVNDVTIIVWADITAMDSGGWLFCIPANSGWTSPFVALGLARAGSGDTARLYASHSGSVLDSGDSGGSFLATGQGMRMYAVTRSAATMRWYLNGKFHSNGTFNYSGNMDTLPAINMGIGGRAVLTGEYISGTYPLALVFNRVLSESEIALLYAFPFIWTDAADFGIPFIPAAGAGGGSIPRLMDYYRKRRAA